MDTYSKFILTVIAVGLWALVIALFMQPTSVEAQRNVQEVRVVGWSTRDTVRVDVHRINGITPSFSSPIPVKVRD